MKCSSFCIQDNLLCCCCFLAYCCCFVFVFFFDGPPGTAGLLTQHVYLAFGCENTQTRTAAQYTKSVFLHCSGSNLNLCLTNARVKRDTKVLLFLLNNSCSHCEDFGGQTECASLQHAVLCEKILAAGSDLVSTHRGKEVVLVFNKDTGEALNIACNTESDVLQQF